MVLCSCNFYAYYNVYFKKSSLVYKYLTTVSLLDNYSYISLVSVNKISQLYGKYHMKPFILSLTLHIAKLT